MIEMIQGDCKIEMAKMKDGEYDLAIVDPPYGINADGRQNEAAVAKIRLAYRTAE